MAKIFAKQIKRGAITIDDVPEKWRAQVAQMIAESEVG